MPNKQYPASPARFPTPSEVQEGEACRTFHMPPSDEWLGALMGAINILSEEWAWFPDGALTPAEAAACWNDIINQAYADAPTATCEGGTPPDSPTPFWDGGSNVDDSSSPETQPWYGYVEDEEAEAAELTFIESAAVWVLTGFIAYSGDIGAAIMFNTVAPRFVLAWRRGDVGEVFRVVIDSADYATMDTSAAAEGDILTMPVLPAEAETHDILIVKMS